MDGAANLLLRSNELLTREATTSDHRPPVYKAIGISLAISSGLFIGTSFVLKKMGLLKANVKYNEEAGEGYGYLKNAYWWTGMTLMIIGEICNFVAYAFVDAILVTPLGALSVVITTVLSAIFLKERLSFVGKVGCFMCIIGSVVIVMNAPAQSSAATIQDMKHFVLAPGFLSYAGVVIVGCTFIALWAGPRYGKKSMLVYLSICSLIGGLSVVATQGLGAAVVSAASGIPQFNQWFLYVLFVFIIATLVTEIIFLNKALNLFNAALVTPTYYVYFTSSTIITSAILFQGFKGTPTSIITVVMGFFVICSGVVLLQLSKSSKDVPDTAVFSGDLDQIRTVAEQEEPESEPKADAIRGTAAIIRRLSQSRQKMEIAEAKRIHEERMKEQMTSIGEHEEYEWDGLRRRKTVISGPGSLKRVKNLHPPLGMTHFPDEDDLESRPSSTDIHGGAGFRRGFLNSFRRPGRHESVPNQSTSLDPGQLDRASLPQRPLTDIVQPTQTGLGTAYHGAGSMELNHVYGLPSTLRPHGATSPTSPLASKPISWAEDVEILPPSRSGLGSPAPTPPPHAAKRQFSFQNPFSKHKHDRPNSPNPENRPRSRLGIGSRGSSRDHNIPGLKSATEEERLGLVKGDGSHTTLPTPSYTEGPGGDDDDDDDGWPSSEGKSPVVPRSPVLPTGREERGGGSGSRSSAPLIRDEKEGGGENSSESGGRSSDEMRRDWGRGRGNGGSFV